MLVEPKESVWLRSRPTHGEAKENHKNCTGKGAGSLKQGDQASAVEQQLAGLGIVCELSWRLGIEPRTPKVGWRWTYDTAAAM